MQEMKTRLRVITFNFGWFDSRKYSLIIRVSIGEEEESVSPTGRATKGMKDFCQFLVENFAISSFERESIKL